MAAPASTYSYMVPIQQQLVDKTTGEALALGVVKFWSNAAHTVPKNVFAQSQTTPFGFVNIGPVLTLSGIGTFVNPNDGTNITPFLWPYQGDPTSPPSPLVAEPYFIQVYNADGVLQFTQVQWPPNIISTASISGSTTTLVTTYTSGISTWTRDAQTLYVMFECMGSGGGGGGTINSGSGAQIAGGGGGAGGYSRTTVNSSVAGPSQNVTVGAAGAGGAAGANPGTNGNPSSVGSLCIANGGTGGATAQDPGAGATAGTGDIAATGASGKHGVGASINTLNVGSGDGANTMWGGGGVGRRTQSDGANATGYGAGGSAGVSTNAGGAAAGGNGAPGFVIITEYLSS